MLKNRTEFFIIFNELDPISPLSSFTLNLIGLYLTSIMLLCIFFNSLLLIIFFRFKDLRNNFNLFIIAVSALNLIGSIAFPFAIHSTFKQRWTSSKYGCYLSGFGMYFPACTNVYLMTLISSQRYYVLKSTTNANKITEQMLIFAIIVCIFIGLFWSLMPLIGWSHYSLEDNYVGCAVEWKERTTSVISYNICIFIFVFIIPFSIIIFTNNMSINIVRNIRADISNSNNFKYQKMFKVEKKMTFILAIYIGGFVLTWTPYGLVSLYSAFINPEHISPLMSTLPALFAKSSLVWSPVFYIFSHKGLMKKLNNDLFT